MDYKRLSAKEITCIYCGKSAIYSSVCYSCRNLYQKKRRGFGGYPSYDTYAEGNNGR